MKQMRKNTVEKSGDTGTRGRSKGGRKERKKERGGFILMRAQSERSVSPVVPGPPVKTAPATPVHLCPKSRRAHGSAHAHGAS